MEYKGYVGTVQFDEEAEILHGEIINMRDVVTFQADTVEGLKKSFSFRSMTISTSALNVEKSPTSRSRESSLSD